MVIIVLIGRILKATVWKLEAILKNSSFRHDDEYIIYFFYHPQVKQLEKFAKKLTVRNLLKAHVQHLIYALNETKYSRMDQVKFVEDSL